MWKCDGLLLLCVVLMVGHCGCGLTLYFIVVVDHSVGGSIWRVIVRWWVIVLVDLFN